MNVLEIMCQINPLLYIFLKYSKNNCPFLFHGDFQNVLFVVFLRKEDIVFLLCKQDFVNCNNSTKHFLTLS